MLTSIMLIPLLGALILCLLKEETLSDISRVKRVALLTTLVTFVLSMVLWTSFDSSLDQYQFTAEYNKLSFLHMHIGVDGLSLYFVLLTTFTMPICLLAC
jgi:NADH:ubiquinone oxidoreductase subunit 4 (subunit M)